MASIAFLGNRSLSPKAMELVEFDRDSILQAAAGRKGPRPSVFLADPDLYERNGRILRDSESPRLLAYSPVDNALYANDGCNSCTHLLQVPLEKLDAEGIRAFAAENRLSADLLAGISGIASIDPKP